jgi:hypothetical protein
MGLLKYPRLSMAFGVPGGKKKQEAFCTVYLGGHKSFFSN